MPQMLRKICCFSLAWLCLSSAWSQFFHHAEVREVSRSGKSIVLQSGSLDGLTVGVHARFYRDEEKLDFIGMGRLIKANDSYSFWYFGELPEDLRPSAQ